MQYVIAGAAIVGALSTLGLSGTSQQAPPGLIAFEVASVKLHDPADPAAMMVAQPGGRFTVRNISLRMLIRTAYRLQDDQMSGGPSWLASARFDIDAKAEEGAPPGQLLAMIQSLLADRFKMEAHHETKELPIYALVLARSDGSFGPKLRRNDCVRDEKAPTSAAPGATQPPCGSISNGFGSLTLRATPLEQILQFLSPAVSRVVVDRTGLQGNFDVDLTWTPDSLPPRTPGTPPDQPLRINGVDIDPNGPSIFTAIQEQLGLKLESTKGPVDVLVIDRVERPTPN